MDDTQSEVIVLYLYVIVNSLFSQQINFESKKNLPSGQRI